MLVGSLLLAYPSIGTKSPVERSTFWCRYHSRTISNTFPLGKRKNPLLASVNLSPAGTNGRDVPLCRPRAAPLPFRSWPTRSTPRPLVPDVGTAIDIRLPLPSRSRLCAVPLRAALRHSLRSVPPLHSRSPTTRPKRSGKSSQLRWQDAECQGQHALLETMRTSSDAPLFGEQRVGFLLNSCGKKPLLCSTTPKTLHPRRRKRTTIGRWAISLRNRGQ